MASLTCVSTFDLQDISEGNEKKLTTSEGVVICRHLFCFLRGIVNSYHPQWGRWLLNGIAPLDVLTMFFSLITFYKKLSLTRFFKNSIFLVGESCAWVNKKKQVNNPKDGLSHQNVETRHFERNETAIFGATRRSAVMTWMVHCPLHFWPMSNATLNSFHAVHDTTKIKNSKPFLDSISRSPQMIDLCVFATK